MRRRTFLPAAAFLFVLGCAAMSLASCTEADCADLATCEAPTKSDAGTDARPARDGAATEPASPPAKNPYGEDYPTENLGWTPRERGSSTPGNVIPNVVFESALKGMLRAPTSGASQLREPEPLQLAELFDPEERKHDVIVLVLATTWDAESRQFFEELRQAPNKTVVLSVIGERTPTGEAPTRADLFGWSEAHYWAWTALDGGFTKLGKLQERAHPKMPVIALIDATTMEIASFSAGRLSTDALAAEIQAIRLRQ